MAELAKNTGGRVMSSTVFEQLAGALDRLPNGFPRTNSQVEIRILQKIFSPEEAALASQLTGSLESVDEIARRARLPAGEVSKRLFKMVRRGMVWLDKQDGEACFRLAPFVVGIYESQREILDHELAHLVEEYFAHGGADGIMRYQPALHRVIPAQGAVKSEWVLPYDDVRAILLQAKTFQVNDCICRVQQALLGHACDFPKNMCLSLFRKRTPCPAGGYFPGRGVGHPGSERRDRPGAYRQQCDEGGGVCLQLLRMLLRDPAGHYGLGDREIGRVCQLLCDHRP